MNINLQKAMISEFKKNYHIERNYDINPHLLQHCTLLLTVESFCSVNTTVVTNTNILIQRRKKQWKLEIPWLWIGTLEIRFGIGKNV